MKLGTKLIWIMGGVMAALAILFHLASAHLLLGGFRDVENERARLNLERVVSALKRSERNLLATVADWSVWDAAYQFVADGNEDYQRENLSYSTLMNLRIDVMAIANSAGHIVWSGALSENTDALIPAPEGVLRRLGGGPLSAFTDSTNAISGLISIDEGTLMVAARPILPTDAAGEPRGALLMGFYLDEDYMAELQEDLRLQISILAATPSSARPDTEIVHGRIGTGEPAVRAVDHDRLEAVGMVDDVAGNPLLQVHVEMPRDIYRQGLRTYRAFSLLLVIGGVILSVLLFLLLRRFVLAPLAKLGAQVNAVAQNPNGKIAVSLPGTADELAALANHINRMLQREQASRAEIVDSRHQYELLFRNMLTGFALHEAICDTAGRLIDYRFLSVNPAFEHMTGLTAKATVGHTVRELLPDIEPHWFQRYERVVRDGHPLVFEEYSGPLDRFFDIRAFRTAPGQFAVMFTDITDRKRAEHKVQVLLDESNRSRLALLGILEDEQKARQAAIESQANYRNLFENMPSGFAHCRMVYEGGRPVDFVYMTVNPAFERITRLQNAVGRRVSELIPGIRESNPEVFEIYGRVANGASPEKFETLVPELGIWFDISVHCPQPGEFVAIFNDITARKQSEQMLQLQGAALAATANAIVITNRKGVIEWANPAFATVTGYSVGEAIGHTPQEIVKSGRHDRAFYSGMWKTILSGQVWRGEIVNRRKNGELYPEEMTITPVHDAEGKISHFVAVKQDITERKRLEEHLLRTQRLESVGRLASGIAHDLNNILTPVLLAPPILREVIQDPAVLNIVDSIELSAKRGAAIIKQLLTFGRGAPEQRVPVSLRTLAREMLKIINETFPKNIQAQFNPPADLALVTGDPTQLHQVLMNLCVNARDAMPGGGELRLSITPAAVDEAAAAANPGVKSGDFLCLSVRDTGTGIAPEHQEKIFDPFFTTKAPGEGTGLGLATVLSIVRGHGGFVQLDSRMKQGTTFRIYLPAARHAAEPDTADPQTKPARGNGETVLLVDDERQVRQVTARLLERMGYVCRQAASGEEALSELKAGTDHIRVVVTDLMMPGMDGITLIRRLREIAPQLPIIAVSGHIANPDSLRYVREQSRYFLNKPYETKALLDALHRLFAES